MMGEVEIVSAAISSEALGKVVSGEVSGAVLPIENSLHGSVAEHYDLLLRMPVKIEGEGTIRIRHNLIGMPRVKLEDVRRVLSHPVAISQCRRYLESHSDLEVVPFYDTAGSVKHVMAQGLRDVAGIAPELAAKQYGGEILVVGIEDHAENYTRFHWITAGDTAESLRDGAADKMSLAFHVEHQPGTLVEALQGLAEAGVNLTKIESRPVVGRPWEYVFYVDVRYRAAAQAEEALQALGRSCAMVKVLGRYRAASLLPGASHNG